MKCCCRLPTASFLAAAILTSALATAQTTFVVISAADSGAGTLRAAITAANAAPGRDTIVFKIGSGVRTIKPLSALPAILDPVLLDGTTQPGFAGSPVIVLDGSLAGPSAGGLAINAGNTTVRALCIHGFSGQGINLGGKPGNVIQGNFIGTDVTGTLAHPNARSGITIFSSGHLIGTNGDGTDDASEGNLISGNEFNGILMRSANDNVIAGNLIGTDVTGTRALPNTGAGIVLNDHDSRNRIGTNSDGIADAAERNVISGNGNPRNRPFNSGPQVGIQNLSQSNVVAGNFIGTDITGTRSLGRLAAGVVIFGAGSNRIGTNGDGVRDAAERNIISGNGDGVMIISGSADSNIVAGNYIGTDVSGTLALGNSGTGVRILANRGNKPTGNRIGTNGDGVADAAERNIIAANGGGVNIGGADQTVVAGNFIGTDVTGKLPLPNLGAGVVITGSGTTFSRANRVGTNGDGVADVAERNVIVASAVGANPAVVVAGAGSDGNVVAGNFIGTDATGKVAFPHLGSVVIGAPRNVIGTNGDGNGDAIEGNLIAGITNIGVQVVGADATGNVVAGNTIGLDLSGARLGNSRFGVLLQAGAHDNFIGTNGDSVSDRLEGNHIAFSGAGGVVLLSGATGNRIRGNSIHDNGGLGIDLDSDGATANDAGDADTGPNGRQNFPVVAMAVCSGTTLSVQGTLDSAPSSTFTLDFYGNQVCDPSGFGEGRTFLGSLQVTTDASGKATFSGSVPAGNASCGFVTATATDPLGNTSEFSRCREAATRIPFASFVVEEAEIELRQAPKGDEFEVEGHFAPGPTSTGINPLTQDVTLSLGSFVTTIGAGSFRLENKDKKRDDHERKEKKREKKEGKGTLATFEFEGLVNGVRLEFKLRIRPANLIEFKVEGEGADLSGLKNPLRIGLAIGIDEGETTVVAEFDD